MIKANFCKLINNHNDKCFVIHSDAKEDVKHILKSYMDQSKTHSPNQLFKFLTEHDPTYYDIKIIKEVTANDWDEVRQERYKIADEIDNCINSMNNETMKRYVIKQRCVRIE